MNLPLQIYDFISILFPGVILLIISKVEFSSLPIWSIEKGSGQLAVLFVAAYVIGHFLQGITRISSINKIMRLFAKKSKDSVQTNSTKTLQGRHYSLPISDPVEDEFNKCFKGFYGIEPHLLGKDEAFNLVFSPIQDKMATRSIFVAIANLHRAMGILSLIYFFYLIGKTIYIIFSPDQQLFFLKTILIIFFTFLSSIVFIRGIDYFKKFTDIIPYFSFIAWYKEKQLERDS
ncbi:hypothetical protein [Ammoniphilus sp. CFH 90114]|uniref:hypothetical protein n=1 Tax=Ammoniphilus sp. CFH 90114 TaxID=2493665 RepID=UPI00100DC9E5|nr:hypothetical protein [Ammoniphilus sp. CFH 90114]RXT07770.1 hypothetical protein EIZ39_10065 [Ammoniphilus sp. CFH 90114]